MSGNSILNLGHLAINVQEAVRKLVEAGGTKINGIKIGQRLVDIELKFTEVQETDAEKITRLENEVKGLKVNMKIMQELYTPKLPPIFDLRNIRINEDDCKRPSLDELMRGPQAS